jgi:hypothetical protein
VSPPALASAFGSAVGWPAAATGMWQASLAGERPRRGRVSCGLQHSSGRNRRTQAAPEWKGIQGEQMPDAFSAGITKHLFDAKPGEAADYSPMEALASSNLGATSNVKLNTGASEFSFDRQGIQRLKSDGTWWKVGRISAPDPQRRRIVGSGHPNVGSRHVVVPDPAVDRASREPVGLRHAPP